MIRRRVSACTHGPMDARIADSGKMANNTVLLNGKLVALTKSDTDSGAKARDSNGSILMRPNLYRSSLIKLLKKLKSV